MQERLQLSEARSWMLKPRCVKAHGCETIYKKQVSSVAERPEPDAAIKSFLTGQKWPVAKLTRLAHNRSPNRGTLAPVFMQR